MGCLGRRTNPGFFMVSIFFSCTCFFFPNDRQLLFGWKLYRQKWNMHEYTICFSSSTDFVNVFPNSLLTSKSFFSQSNSSFILEHILHAHTPLHLHHFSFQRLWFILTTVKQNIYYPVFVIRSSSGLLCTVYIDLLQA